MDKCSHSNVADFETIQILNMMLFAPELFEHVMIFESDEIENFDIGFVDFYLKDNENIQIEVEDWACETTEALNNLRSKIIKKYTVHLQMPKTEDKVIFIKGRKVGKIQNMLGQVESDPELNYGERIKKHLETT
jgi:hypothetical protein